MVESKPDRADRRGHPSPRRRAPEPRRRFSGLLDAHPSQVTTTLTQRRGQALAEWITKTSRPAPRLRLSYLNGLEKEQDATAGHRCLTSALSCSSETVVTLAR
jgi:hypothetical protein